jgi:hypothetical protein
MDFWWTAIHGPKAKARHAKSRGHLAVHLQSHELKAGNIILFLWQLISQTALNAYDPIMVLSKHPRYHIKQPLPIPIYGPII